MKLAICSGTNRAKAAKVEVNVMTNKKGAFILLIATVFTFISLILPFQEVSKNLKGIVSINKPIATIAGIAALILGILAMLASAVGKKEAVLVFGFLATACMFFVVNRTNNVFFGVKIAVSNKIGYTMCWISAFVMAISTLFAYLTTPRYESRK